MIVWPLFGRTLAGGFWYCRLPLNWKGVETRLTHQTRSCHRFFFFWTFLNIGGIYLLERDMCSLKKYEKKFFYQECFVCTLINYLSSCSKSLFIYLGNSNSPYYIFLKKFAGKCHYEQSFSSRRSWRQKKKWQGR